MNQINNRESDKSKTAECIIQNVGGSYGIKVDVNPFNDPRWSNRTGIHEEHKVQTLRAYELAGNKITFQKPPQNKCFSVLCLNKTLYGVPTYKVKNWEELPNKLPYNEDILKSPFFLGKNVKVV